MFPLVGLEWEFYLLKGHLKIGHEDPIIEQFIFQLNTNLVSKGLLTIKVEKEQGHGQIEIKTSPNFQIARLCADFLVIKEVVIKTAKQMLLDASFVAQQFNDDCGSSLQINCSLINENNDFLFAKKVQDESSLLLYSIGGIVTLAKSMMIFCAPREEDYLRYDPRLNQALHKNKKYPAPTSISWGYDNRTTMIRIPRTNKINERRLEFRLPASDADVYLVIMVTLMAIRYGLENRIQPAKALYGNAFDDHYQVPKLPTNYQTAEEGFFLGGHLLAEIIEIISTNKIECKSLNSMPSIS